MKLPRRKFLHLAAGAAALPVVPRSARAQAYPARPVRLIVTVAAGSSPDVIARLMAQWLSERLGQPFVVENRSGANIGTEFVVRAPPDGYTVMLAVSANAINASLYPNLGFNFIRDIAPVASISTIPLVMEVNPSVPARTVPEFIAYAKANPGKINMASGGTGSPLHVAGELFKMIARVDMVHVPYRSEALALPDLISGQVQVLFSDVPGALAHIRSGALRALAVTTASRSAFLPDVPTVGETVADYASSTWYGTGVPRNTPSDVIERLNSEINAGLNDPSIRAQLSELGVTPLVFTPAAFRSHIEAESEKWGKVIRAANIKAE